MENINSIFKEYKGQPIALYGLGTETKRVLSGLGEEFCVVGLLDGFRDDGNIYGKRIMPLSDCIEKKVKLIIVVARPGSCRAIVKRIGGFCKEHKIGLMDFRGKNLYAQNKISYELKSTPGITKKRLEVLADANDIISFDLFDTLVMRQALFPSDVIELAECKLKEKKVYINDFCKKRQRAEKELSRETAPTLEKIYEYVLAQSESVDVSARELAEIEWSIDYQLIVPRQEMVDFARELYVRGKPIYIVTDSYYQRERIEKILSKCGIIFFSDILVSCEFNTGKTQKLFGELNKIAKGKRCLHIGDDLTADIENAKKEGISACQIYSAFELLEQVGYFGMWEHMDYLASKIKIGMFTARMFNTPFQFETDDRKLCIKTAYNIGYLLIAPIIADFTVWFWQQVKEEKLGNIWFSARDGYLVKKLYDILEGRDSSVYFLTSRLAAIRSGIEDEADIEYVAGMKYSGTLQDQLKVRFGIFVNREETKDKTLSDFSEDIERKAGCNKKNYQRYIEKLNVKEGDIAFFDFVAKGTSQMYISRLVDNHLKGFYFIWLEKDYMKDKMLDIKTFFENTESDSCTVYEDYYILETILTSNEPSVIGFDEKGDAVYTVETRSEGDLNCCAEVQQGIIDFFREYIQICPQSELYIDKKLDEILLGLIHNLSILDKRFMALRVEDPFFNRTTDLADLI